MGDVAIQQRQSNNLIVSNTKQYVLTMRHIRRSNCVTFDVHRAVSWPIVDNLSCFLLTVSVFFADSDALVFNIGQHDSVAASYLLAVANRAVTMAPTDYHNNVPVYYNNVVSNHCCDAAAINDV